MYISLFVVTIAYYGINSSLFFDLTSDISKLLSTTGNVVGSFMSIISLRIVCFRQHEILNFLKSSNSFLPDFQPLSSRHKKFVVIANCLLMYSLQLAFSLELDTVLTFTINEPIDRLMQLFPKESQPALNIAIVSIGYLLKGILLQGCAIYIMGRLLLIVLVLQLTELGIKFEEFVKQNERTGSVVRVMDEYNKLRDLVKCANSWAGGLLLALYIISVSFLANLPGIIRDTSEAHLGRWYPVTYCAIMGLFMFFACDLPHRVCINVYYCISEFEIL